MRGSWQQSLPSSRPLVHTVSTHRHKQHNTHRFCAASTEQVHSGAQLLHLSQGQARVIAHIWRAEQVEAPWPTFQQVLTMQLPSRFDAVNTLVRHICRAGSLHLLEEGKPVITCAQQSKVEHLVDTPQED